MTINIDRAFSWYYQLYPSVIAGLGLDLKNRLAESAVGDKDVHKRIIAMADYAHACTNPDEQAECLAYAAFRAAQLGQVGISIDLFTQSTKVLLDDVRSASVLWCLGCDYDQNANQTLAYGNWYASRLLISSLLEVEATKSIHDPQKNSNIQWFESLLDEMNLHLAKLLEEGLYWLHIFDHTGGVDLVKKYENKITGLINQHRYSAARQEIDDLLNLSRRLPDLSRQGAAFMAAAVAESEMGNPQKAITYILDGLSRYRKESHEQVCGKWIAGLILNQDPKTKVRARQYLENAMLEIDQLFVYSDRMNQSNQTNWYSARKLEMQKVIGELDG